MPVFYLLLIFINGSFGTGIQGCKFCYTVQPVVSVSDCNPYENLNGISTKCTINGPRDTPLQIKWFNSTLSQEIFNHSSVFSIQETHAFIGDDRLETQSQLSIHPLSSGQYWCQVFNGDEGFLSSPRLEIQTPGHYRSSDTCDMNSLIESGLKKCDNIIENGASYSVCPIMASSIVSSIISVSDIISLSSVDDTLYSSCSSCSSSLFELEFTVTGTNDLASSLTEMVTTSFGVIPIQSVQPSDSDLISTRRDSFHLWLYILAALTGLFAILIIILTGVCIGLCVIKPNRMPTTLTQQLEQEPTSRPESEEFNDNASRPHTSMTVHTDIPMTPLPPELDSNSAYYDALELEQDYEDLDERDKHFVTPLTAGAHNIIRYHEQGPSVGGTLNSHPPLQPTYSEIGEATASDTLSKHTFGMNNPSTGYGKLDHSRPRQNYYPKRDSPLLSGYRKLEHIQARFKATTLPHNPQPGYANIEIPGATPGAHHLRSVSLPNSEYSNLNPIPYSAEPSTPTHEQSSSKKKYANFDIIEAHMVVEEVDHSPHMSQCSDDYHMLSDATVEHHMQQGEYEFLPNYEEEQSPDELGLSRDQANKVSYHRHILGSLGKDPLGEQISVASSQSSADFTGPFFFPHMVESSELDHHIYRPLDISTMEPEQSYTSVKKNYK